MILTQRFALLVAVVALCASSALAQQGQLQIDVSGVPGSGVTTWEFSTNVPGNAEADGTVRDVTNADFSGFDTGQFPFGQDTILDTNIQNQVFLLTGNAEITVGGNTEMIGGIFLDDDGGSADDLGVRTVTDLPFLAGDIATWTGTGTAPVDINAFVLGPWSLNDIDGQRMFIAEEVLVNFTAVPEPASFGLLGLAGLALLGIRRR